MKLFISMTITLLLAFCSNNPKKKFLTGFVTEPDILATVVILFGVNSADKLPEPEQGVNYIVLSNDSNQILETSDSISSFSNNLVLIEATVNEDVFHHYRFGDYKNNRIRHVKIDSLSYYQSSVPLSGYFTCLIDTRSHYPIDSATYHSTQIWHEGNLERLLPQYR